MIAKLDLAPAVSDRSSRANIHAGAKAPTLTSIGNAIMVRALAATSA
jgi:hypothetical protein